MNAIQISVPIWKETFVKNVLFIHGIPNPVGVVHVVQTVKITNVRLTVHVTAVLMENLGKTVN